MPLSPRHRRPHHLPLQRRTLGTGAAAVITLMALAAPSSAVATSTLIAPRTSPNGSPVPATQARGLRLGVQSNVSWRDYDALVQELDLMEKAGVSWMRLDVSWASLQERNSSSYSQWYVNRLDRITAEASRRNIKILGTIIGTPTWMPAKAHTRYRLPTNPAPLQETARLLAQRYAGTIDAWQVWNEPDCDMSTCSTVDPAEYVPLLKAGYQGIKSGNPQATVVSAGFSGIDQRWLERFYAAGARPYFDALALHPYIAPANGSPRLDPVGTNPYRMTNTPMASAVMGRYGDASKPIWFTEFGWTTGRQPGVYDGVTEETQAYYLRDAALLVHDNYPQVTHMFWYAMRDRDDSDVYENNFGVVRQNGSPKPAYWALRETETLLK